MKKQTNTTKALWLELQDRRLIGGQLANCAFNLDQRKKMDAQDCAILKQLQQKWDKIPAVRVKGKV